MISHDHHCIFTHVPKTAGKSVRSLFGLPEFETDYREKIKGIQNAFGHEALFGFVGEPFFNDYFKFAFVRNPYDRLVSAYFYLDAGGCNETDKQFFDEHLAIYKGEFAAFVEDLSTLTMTTHFKPQIDWICDSNRNILTDFVGRYEALERDMAIIGSQINLSIRDIPVMNASRHEEYRTYYDESTKRKVAEVYAEDFDVFSYQFDL